MANITLYCRDEEKPIIDRAIKLAAFHDDKSLSAIMVEQAKKIVAKYDGKK